MDTVGANFTIIVQCGGSGFISSCLSIDVMLLTLSCGQVVVALGFLVISPLFFKKQIILKDILENYKIPTHL